MIQFKKMIEVAQRWHDNNNQLSLKLLSAIEECEIFVFRPTNKEQQHLGDDDVEEFNQKVDAPFKVFSMEFSGNTPITSMGNENKAHELDDVQILCILAIEILPNDFSFYILSKEIKRGVIKNYEIISTDKVGKQGLYNWCMELMSVMLEKLSSQKIGIELVREKFKIGSGKTKRYHKIRRVIHVSPKREISEAKSSMGREIDWTHRFSVRGHWRDHDGIGKDRDDNYCIEGKTWVKSHVRGPEDKPLIKKQRVVL